MFERLLSLLFASGKEGLPETEPVYRDANPIWLSDDLAHHTQKILRSFRTKRGPHEGIVYWCGIEHGATGGVVTTLVVPGAITGPGHVETSPTENAAVLTLLDRQEIVLLGQAHSHPPGAGARHSQGDNEWTFSPFEGAISVVVPNYAQSRDDFTTAWGVHRFLNGRYELIQPEERANHLRIVPQLVDRRK